MNGRSRAFYRAFSLSLALIFAVVGAVFLLLPREMLAFFNTISRRLGLVEGPAEGSFFGALAAAYMYVVTVLAWLMFRWPREKIYSLLLGQAKLASAAVSFLLFAFQAPWLIYLVNGIVDAALGLTVLAMYFRVKRWSGLGGEGRS